MEKLDSAVQKFDTSQSKIQDKFSDKFKCLEKGASTAVVSMEKLDRAVQKFDTSQSKITQKIDLSHIFEQAAEDSKRKIGNTAAGIHNLGKATENSAELASSAWSGFRNVIKGIGIVAAVASKKVFDLTIGGALNLDTMEREFQARLGSEANGTALYNHLAEQAKTSAFGLGELSNNTSSFLSMTTNKKNIDDLNAITERLALFDKTGQGLEGAGFSLKEAMSGDIVSLAERFNMPKNMIREFGIDKLGKSGDIEGFITQMNKMLEAMNMGEEAYAAMIAAPEKQLNMFVSNMKEQFAEASRSGLEALIPLINQMNEWFQSEQAAMFFNAVSMGLSLIVNGLIWIIGKVQQVFDFIKANWEWLAPILTIIGTVLLAQMTVKLWAMVAPILAQAAAWLVANWWIIVLVGLIIFVIGVLNACGVKFEEVCAFIGFWFGVLYAFIYNRIIRIWNFIIIFVEFFANCFNNPVTAIANLFVDLADSVLSTIETIANAIDSVFGTKLGEAVSSWRDNLQNWAKDNIAENKFKFERKAELNIGDTALKFSGYGRELSNGISNLSDTFTNLFGSSESSPAPENNSDYWGKETDHINSVGEIENDVNIADEDLQFLRDVAEMRYVQNFVTLTPTVAVDAVINERADIDEVTSEIERRLEQEFAVAAEGTYS